MPGRVADAIAARSGTEGRRRANYATKTEPADTLQGCVPTGQRNRSRYERISGRYETITFSAVIANEPRWTPGVASAVEVGQFDLSLIDGVD